MSRGKVPVNNSYGIPKATESVSLRDDSDQRDFCEGKGIGCDALDSETVSGIAKGLGFKRAADLVLYTTKQGKTAVYATTTGPARGVFVKLMEVSGDSFAPNDAVKAELNTKATEAADALRQSADALDAIDLD